jgi:hypothetical protein
VFHKPPPAPTYSGVTNLDDNGSRGRPRPRRENVIIMKPSASPTPQSLSGKGNQTRDTLSRTDVRPTCYGRVAAGEGYASPRPLIRHRPATRLKKVVLTSLRTPLLAFPSCSVPPAYGIKHKHRWCLGTLGARGCWGRISRSRCESLWTGRAEGLQRAIRSKTLPPSDNSVAEAKGLLLLLFC